MAIQSRTTLKNWFLTGLKPLQSQFHDWIDSFWHKDEEIPAASITGLNDALAEIPPIIEISSTDSASANIPAGKLLDCIAIVVDSNETVKIGTTAGGDDIETAQIVAAFPRVVSISAYFKTATTIYFTGTATIKIYLR